MLVSLFPSHCCIIHTPLVHFLFLKLTNRLTADDHLSLTLTADTQTLKHSISGSRDYQLDKKEGGEEFAICLISLSVRVKRVRVKKTD